MGSRILILLLFLSSFGASAGLMLKDYPGLQLVDSAIGNSVESHRIILGSLKKVIMCWSLKILNTLLVPKGLRHFLCREREMLIKLKIFIEHNFLRLGKYFSSVVVATVDQVIIGRILSL